MYVPRTARIMLYPCKRACLSGQRVKTLMSCLFQCSKRQFAQGCRSGFTAARKPSQPVEALREVM
jgi:hypothetical protein